ncbi:uncharacterized protein V6R79_016914 [Siganus canaliculatus]
MISSKRFALTMKNSSGYGAQACFLNPTSNMPVAVPKAEPQPSSFTLPIKKTLNTPSHLHENVSWFVFRSLRLKSDYADSTPRPKLSLNMTSTQSNAASPIHYIWFTLASASTSASTLTHKQSTYES